MEIYAKRRFYTGSPELFIKSDKITTQHAINICRAELDGTPLYQTFNVEKSEDFKSLMHTICYFSKQDDLQGVSNSQLAQNRCRQRFKNRVEENDELKAYKVKCLKQIGKSMLYFRPSTKKLYFHQKGLTEIITVDLAKLVE